MAYADDIARICYNKRKTVEVVRGIEKWSSENGLNINKKKSGIMQVISSRQRVGWLMVKKRLREYRS